MVHLANQENGKKSKVSYGHLRVCAFYFSVKGTLNNLLNFSYRATPNMENANLGHKDLSIPVYWKRKNGFEVRFEHPEDISPHIKD